MAISNEQRAFRASRLGSSDATRVMAGAWRALWEEKTGRIAAPDLDHVPCVQIGIATEPLHARFYTNRTGVPCVPAEGTLVHPDFDFIVAHLDFLTWRRAEAAESRAPDTLLEAKFHTGTRRDEELARQYYWQIQHQLLVSGLSYAVLSILRPNDYALLPVERNERDIGTLLDSLHAFWWYVENDVEPADMAGVAAPTLPGTRVLDMSPHNEFAAWAGILADHHEGMQLFREAEAALKALMPTDAQLAFLPPVAALRGDGGALVAPARPGVVLARSKDGRLSLRLGEVPKRHHARAERWAPAVPHFDDVLRDMELTSSDPARPRRGAGPEEGGTAPSDC